jgi:Fic family protein
MPQNIKELHEIAFNAHLDLATIHPWVDGNGRTARLLMNFLQFHFKIAPTKIFLEDKAKYVASLKESQDTNDNLHFLNFMALEHLKTLEFHCSLSSS